MTRAATIMNDLVSLDDYFSQVRFRLLLDPTTTFSVPSVLMGGFLVEAFLVYLFSTAGRNEAESTSQNKAVGREGRAEKKGEVGKKATAPVRHIPSCKIKHDFYSPGASSCIV